MGRYRTKPFEIDAIQYDGDNLREVMEEFPEAQFEDGYEDAVEVYDYLQDTWVTVNVTDYIIKGMKGEYYPCDAEVFEAKYESV